MTAVKPKWADLGGTHKELIARILTLTETGDPVTTADLRIDDIDVCAELAEMGAIEFGGRGSLTVHTKPPETHDRAAQHNRAQTTADRAHLDEITAWQHQITQVLTQRHNSTDGDRTLKRRIAVLERARQLIEQKLTK